MKTFITFVFSFMACFNTNCQVIDKIEAKHALSIVSIRDTVETVLIDGRSAEMFAEKHIKGAINIDAFRDSAESQLEEYLEKDTIVVYCTNHRRSETIIEKLKGIQYQGKIIFITDGINAWITAGFPIVKT